MGLGGWKEYLIPLQLQLKGDINSISIWQMLVHILYFFIILNLFVCCLLICSITTPR